MDGEQDGVENAERDIVGGEGGRGLATHVLTTSHLGCKALSGASQRDQKIVGNNDCVREWGAIRMRTGRDSDPQNLSAWR
jgi:hypothetical protein